MLGAIALAISMATLVLLVVQTRQLTHQTRVAQQAAVFSFNLDVMIRLQEVLFEIADDRASYEHVWGNRDPAAVDNLRPHLSSHAMADMLSLATSAGDRLPGFSRNERNDWISYTRYVLAASESVRREVLANPEWWPEITPFASEAEQLATRSERVEESSARLDRSR